MQATGALFRPYESLLKPSLATREPQQAQESRLVPPQVLGPIPDNFLLYERMQELILASPGRAFTSFDFLPFYRDVFRQFVLRKSHDEIGRLNGWRFHRDGLHLNSQSGKLLADLVQEFLLTETISSN